MNSDPSRPNWWGLTKFHNFGQISPFQPNFTILEYLEYLEYLELGQFHNFFDVLYFRPWNIKYVQHLQYLGFIEFERMQGYIQWSHSTSGKLFLPFSRSDKTSMSEMGFLVIIIIIVILPDHYCCALGHRWGAGLGKKWLMTLVICTAAL